MVVSFKEVLVVLDDTQEAEIFKVRVEKGKHASIFLRVEYSGERV